MLTPTAPHYYIRVLLYMYFSLVHARIGWIFYCTTEIIRLPMEKQRRDSLDVPTH